MLFFPVLTLLMEWFCVKRGLANGILHSGTGLGGIAIPFLADTLLNHFGHRLAFIILAGLFAALALPAFIFANPRVPTAQIATEDPVDKSFLQSQMFWLFIGANIVQATANFLPGIYVPSFANDLNLSTTAGTLALALLNGTYSFTHLVSTMPTQLSV
ncbi:hypothetical protein FRB99_006784 [Tulasnella sp. 403]|nr:hypothetical protein FRB99_006784 [Tulasnella sp. 403]